MTALDLATEALSSHSRSLDSLVATLLKDETLDEESLLAVLGRVAVSPAQDGSQAESSPPVTNGHARLDPEC